MKLKLLWMDAVNMTAYRDAASKADPTSPTKPHQSGFVQRYNGPFVQVPGCGSLEHMLPKEWGFVPNEVSEELFYAGATWSLGVKDDLGREIVIAMEYTPDEYESDDDDGYECDDDSFTIKSMIQLKTMKEIRGLVKCYEPQIDHWWCHRKTSANPSEEENENETEDLKQSWEIVVSDPFNIISELNSLLKKDGSEKVEDYIKLHFVMEEDVLYARLVTDLCGNGDFPEVRLELGDSIEAVYSNHNGTDAVDVFVFYNAFMKAIECDTCKVDSILLCYDEDESNDITIKFQESVTFAEEHCPTTDL